MPYSIKTEDGIVLNNIPDNVPRDSPKIKRNIQRLRVDRRVASFGPAAPPSDDTGLFGNFTKGIGTGFVGTGEVGLLGLAALQEEENELASRRKIRDVASSLKPEGGDPDSISFGVGQALGSILGFGTAAGGAALLAPASAATAVGTGVAGALGLATMAGEASERARAAGATEEERNRAIRTATPFGLLEILPLGRIIKSVDVPVLGKLMRELGGNKAEEVGGAIQNAFVTGGIEGAQEATTEIIQNLTEQQYNDLAETFGGVGEAAAYGGIAGGLLDLFLGGRARRTTETTPDDTDVDESGQLKLFPDDDAPEFKLGEAETSTLSNEIDALENSGLTREQAIARLAKELGTTEANIKNVLPPIDAEAEAARIAEEERQGDLFAQPSPKQLEMDVRPKTAGALPAPAPDADFAVSEDGTIITGKKSKELEKEKRQKEEEERVEREPYIRDMPKEEVLDKRRQFEFEQRQKEARATRNDVQGDLFSAQLEDAELAELEAIVAAEESSAEDVQLAEQVLASYGRKKIARERREQAATGDAPVQIDLLEDAAETAELEAMVAEDARKEAERDEAETKEIERLYELERIKKEDAADLAKLVSNVKERKPKITQQQLPLEGMPQTKTGAKKEGVKRLGATETSKVDSQKLGDTGVDLTQKKTTLKPVEDIEAKTKGKTTGKTTGKRIFYELGTEDAKKALKGLTLKQVTDEQTTAKTNTAPEGSGTITYENTIPRGRETTTAQDGEKIQALLGRDLSKPKNETKAQAKERNELKRVQRFFANADSPQTTIFERPDDAAVAIGFDVQAAKGPEIEAVGSFKLDPEGLTQEQIAEQNQNFRGRGGANAVAAQNWAKKTLSNEFNQLVDKTANIEEAAQTRVKEGGLDDATIIYNRKQDEQAKKDAEKARLAEATAEK